MKDTVRIITSMLFAMATVSAAFLLRGTPLAYLVETALMGVAVALLVLKQPVCSRQR